ncbi:hypothetical protein FBU30_002989 [Linnemannia zychae]|nr:hypothetical protein FBU30_002989 [Linnemannia zychae]
MGSHQHIGHENIDTSSYQNTADSTLSNKNTAGIPWNASIEKKAKYDHFFEKLDTNGDGFINGNSLSKDEFAGAMKLIYNKNSSGISSPTVLPLSTIPPSLRKQTASSQPKSPQQIIYDNSEEASESSYDGQFISHQMFDLVDTTVKSQKSSVSQTWGDPANNQDTTTLTNLRTKYNDLEHELSFLRNSLKMEEQDLQYLKSEREQLMAKIRSMWEMKFNAEARLRNLTTLKESEPQTIDNLKGSVTKMGSGLTLLRSTLSMTMQELTMTHSNKTAFLEALSKGQEESQELKATIQKN